LIRIPSELLLRRWPPALAVWRRLRTAELSWSTRRWIIARHD